VLHISDRFVSTRYQTKAGYKVELLTPNRGSAAHQAKPARMKTLAGAGAEPLRHLDYLIHQPERSVLLAGGGVPVTVPRAERYAVHKLIVAVERQNAAKSNKDILQAGTLMEALTRKRPVELGEAWVEARAVGRHWIEKIERGAARLTAEQRGALELAIAAYEAFSAPPRSKVAGAAVPGTARPIEKLNRGARRPARPR
jgi:hypothetical protein